MVRAHHLCTTKTNVTVSFVERTDMLPHLFTGEAWHWTSFGLPYLCADNDRSMKKSTPASSSQTDVHSDVAKSDMTVSDAQSMLLFVNMFRPGPALPNTLTCTHAHHCTESHGCKA
eukprot:s740_g9.t1